MTNLKKKLKYQKFTKTNVRNLPESPGVYLFSNKKGEILYIGKSNKLKKRVITYFSTSNILKTRKMIKETKYYSYILVNSELEALLLEARLINKHLPFYNLISRDDKNPLYIKITSEKYPRILTARKIDKDTETLSFYGPFTSSSNVRVVLVMLRKIFPYSDHKLGKKPCLHSQIGLCVPCPNLINATKNNSKKKELNKIYQQNIKMIDKVLKGNIKSVKNNLTKNMNKHSKILEFEKAAQLKSQIEKLDYITQPIIPIGYFLKNPNLIRDIRINEKKYLKKLLKHYLIIKTDLKRIECYDVAHLAGSKPTASMVTFIEGEPEKKLYRHFRIRQRSGQDDTASLSEVAKRRIKHLSTWGVPDLIIVDGGKAQASVFFKVFFEKNIPVVGIAKRNEVLVIPKLVGNKVTFNQIKMPKGFALNLVQRLRNEAHRFARRYHHRLLQKSLLPI